MLIGHSNRSSSSLPQPQLKLPGNRRQRRRQRCSQLLPKVNFSGVGGTKEKREKWTGGRGVSVNCGICIKHNSRRMTKIASRALAERATWARPMPPRVGSRPTHLLSLCSSCASQLISFPPPSCLVSLLSGTLSAEFYICAACKMSN